MSRRDSLQEAIDSLKACRSKLESQLGKNVVEQLFFNLEEIDLDIERLATQLTDCATKNIGGESLSEIFDSFQYGSIPHISGHVETIEQLLEKSSVGTEQEKR